MSYLTDCLGCAQGHHSEHQPISRVGLGELLGGTDCTCTGDCAERHRKRLKDIARIFADAHGFILPVAPPAASAEAFAELRYNATHHDSAMSDEGFLAAIEEIRRAYSDEKDQ